MKRFILLLVLVACTEPQEVASDAFRQGKTGGATCVNAQDGTTTICTDRKGAMWVCFVSTTARTTACIPAVNPGLDAEVNQ